HTPRWLDLAVSDPDREHLNWHRLRRADPLLCAEIADRCRHLGDRLPLLATPLALRRHRRHWALDQDASVERSCADDAHPTSLRYGESRWRAATGISIIKSEEHTSELQSRENLVCR